MENDLDISSPIWNDMLGRVHAVSTALAGLISTNPEFAKQCVAGYPQLIADQSKWGQEAQMGQQWASGLVDQARRILRVLGAAPSSEVEGKGNASPDEDSGELQP